LGQAHAVAEAPALKGDLAPRHRHAVDVALWV
jgi:hypothetical protein